MDTLQIIKIMKTLFKKKKTQFGCIPCDQLDELEIKHYPLAICLNDERTGQPGGHWVGIHIEKKNKPMEFFCSYGKPMRFYPDHFMKFANRNKLKVQEIKICLQSPISGVCGAHVLFYFYNRMRGCSRNAFYAKFSKNSNKNDKIVYSFVDKFIHPRK